MASKPGQDITLEVLGRQVKGYIAGAENSGAPGVLVLHAWWGLTPFFKQLCDRLAAEGFVALSANLYVDKTADTIDGARELMEQRDNEMMKAIALAAIDRLREAAPNGGMGAIGFSMGASWACELAAIRPDDLRSVVTFYGAAEAEWARCKAGFQAHFVENDEWEPAEYVQQMEKDMRAAGLDVTFYHYSGVKHWFFEDNRPDEYNPAAAKLSWERTIGFLGEKLR